jgi:hypothetical protein
MMFNQSKAQFFFAWFSFATPNSHRWKLARKRVDLKAVFFVSKEIMSAVK